MFQERFFKEDAASKGYGFLFLVSSNLGFSGAKGGNTVWGHISLGISVSGRHISCHLFLSGILENGEVEQRMHILVLCLFASLRS